MPTHNFEITEAFNKVADLLEIEGANPFRVRAYREAARTIGGLPADVGDLIAADEPLTDLRGIGKDLARKYCHFIHKLSEKRRKRQRYRGGRQLQAP